MFQKNKSRGSLVVVVMGVGNRIRGDDGIGPAVVSALEEENVCATLFDCGTAPESFIGPVEQKKPKKIIIIDAVDMKMPPGSVDIIDTQKITGMLLSTHKLPLSMTIRALERTGAKIVFIGAQPKAIGFGEEMSSEGRNAIIMAKEIASKEIQDI